MRIMAVMRQSFLLSFFLIFCVVSAFGQLRGKVVAIADGDTFTLLTEENRQIKVRLHGIDCPEKKQDFGARAKQFTSDLIFRKTVSVDEKDIDKYGRTIGIVRLDNGKVLNEELLKAGLAWHYKRYDKNPVWSEMENSARKAKLGIWSAPNPVNPEMFRHR